MKIPIYDIRVNTGTKIYKWDYAHKITINKSWDTFTDTAIIELPSNISTKDRKKIYDEIKEGQQVTIKLGYYPYLKTRFEGYVIRVEPKSTLKIYCEDLGYLLKRRSIKNFSTIIDPKKPNDTASNVSLNELITSIISNAELNDEITFETGDAPNVGTWLIEGASVMQAIHQLKSKYGIYTWFKDGVLKVGLPYTPGLDGKRIDGDTDIPRHRFQFNWNIINHGDLKWQRDFELDVISHAQATNSEGKTLHAYAYYDERKPGEIIIQSEKPYGYVNDFKLSGRNNYTQAQINQWAIDRLPNLYYTGFRGSFSTFGEPAVEHGDIAVLIDKKIPDRNGAYLIKSVEITSGVDGYRQKISLDRVITAVNNKEYDSTIRDFTTNG